MRTFILRFSIAWYSFLGFITGKKRFRDRKLVAGALLLVTLSAILSCNQNKRATCYSVQMVPNTTSDTLVGSNIDSTTIQQNNADTMPEIMCYKSTAPKDR